MRHIHVYGFLFLIIITKIMWYVLQLLVLRITLFLITNIFLFFLSSLPFLSFWQIQILYSEMRKYPAIPSSIAPMASLSFRAFLELKLCKKVNNIRKIIRSICGYPANTLFDLFTFSHNLFRAMFSVFFD